MHVAFVCFPVRGIYGGGFRRLVALKALLLESEKVRDPVRPLCHRDLLVGGRGVFEVCDGLMVVVEDVDGGLGGRGPGLSGPSSQALAPSGRRTGARGLLAGRWALWWAWWGKALVPFRGDFPGILGALVGLVRGVGALNELSAADLQGVALCLVRGAGLVELGLAVPLHTNLHPPVWAFALEAVLDRALTPDPVDRVAVLEGLLDSCAWSELRVCFGLWRCLWWQGR